MLIAQVTTSIHVSIGEVAATLVLVALAIAVSFWRKADLEADIGIAVVRSAIQLTAIGYVIKFIFDQDELIFVVALIAVMVLFGALTARRRARRVPHAFWPLLIGWVVIVTGNHYWVDVALGWMVALTAALVAQRLLARARPHAWAWDRAPAAREAEA